MRYRAVVWRPLVITALAAGALTGAQGGAYAAPAAYAHHPGSVRIITFAGKCFDVKGASWADTTPIIQYHCNGGANQRFRILGIGWGQSQIRTFAGKCLTVTGASWANMTPVIQYHCNGRANQRFRILGIGWGRFQIRTSGGKCLTVRYGSRADRTPIVQYRCTGTYAQRFRFFR